MLVVRWTAALALAAMPFVTMGCGTTKQNDATQQLLTSDAVDRSVANINFSDLAGQRIFFDTKYITDHKTVGFVNSNYVISSLRQQLFAAGCLMQEKPEDADYIVEARIGTLANDEHNIIYGIPANNGLAAATSVLPNSPPVPAIPELSVARRDDQMAAAKIAAFAYDRKNHSIVWQSGLSTAQSTAKDTWVLGAGPFERGTIHDGWQFAGNKIRVPFLKRKQVSGPVAAYSEEMLYARPSPPNQIAEPAKAESDVKQAAAEADAKPAEAAK